jgi:hypothetical protein
MSKTGQNQAQNEGERKRLMPIGKWDVLIMSSLFHLEGKP